MKKFIIFLFIASSAFCHDKDGSADWSPFEWTLAATLSGQYPLVSVTDGGIGARTLFLTESGTSTTTDYYRNGVPLGFGHQWLDSPWHISLAGVDVLSCSNSKINLGWAPTDSNSTIVDARFGKAQHESYLRRISFRTRTAPWQIRFSFDEIIDEEGYDLALPDDLRNLYPGSSKSRITTLNIQRQYPEGQHLSFTHENIRQHRTVIPSTGITFEEFWGDRTSATWLTPVGDSKLGVTVFSNGGDTERERGRKVESVRTGLLTAYSIANRGTLSMLVTADRIADNGIGINVPGYFQANSVGRQQADLNWKSDYNIVGFDLNHDVTAKWDCITNWKANRTITIRKSIFSFIASMGGRTPGSDKLWTLDSRSSADSIYAIIPDRNLDWEDYKKISCSAAGKLVGFDWGLTGTLNSLTDGIGYQPLQTPGHYSWTNNVEMKSWSANSKLERTLNLFGRLHIRSLYSFGGTDVTEGIPAVIMPEQSGNIQLLWERRLFDNDGIIEIGFENEYRGSMQDPWIPGGSIELPSMFLQHLRFGFRLIGADLGIDFRNLGGSQVRLSNGALSNTTEMRYRLHWTLYN
ncbi:MAG: hypothetical protein GY893_07625 [bacterium]|nr:hypothetical protein [bacterium]